MPSSLNLDKQMRKLARVVRIDTVERHPNADALDLCTVGGWRVVSKLGEYKAGDLAVYFEVDAWVPHDLAPFLSKGKEPKEYNGVLGNRLRSIKLRGELSQGLLLPIEVAGTFCPEPVPYEEGQDLTEMLGILKYEPPIPAELAGEAEGPFPTHLVPKTDEERVQNLEYDELRKLRYIVTEKLDGTSATFIKEDGRLRVCGRNWEWKDNDNTYWKVARKYDLLNVLEEGMAVQGEIIGPGIQGNKYGLNEPQLYVFNVWRNRNRVPFAEWGGLRTVPVLDLWYELPETVFDLLTIAEGKSVLNPKTEREGLVLRTEKGEVSFKAISNKFLLKGGL